MVQAHVIRFIPPFKAEGENSPGAKSVRRSRPPTNAPSEVKRSTNTAAWDPVNAFADPTIKLPSWSVTK